MAKKINKIFSEYMAKAMPVSDINVRYDNGEDGIDVHVKNRLAVDERRTFVERVANGCFDSEDEYHPEYQDIIFQITVLQMLTDVPVFSVKIDEIGEDELPTGNKIDVVDIDKTYDLCRCLDLYENVEDDDFRSLYIELQDAAAEKIDFKKRRILAGERKLLERTRAELDDALAMIISVSDKLNETLTNAFSGNQALELTSELAKRAENMSDSDLVQTILATK